jgi:NAD(P)-dependent dehydrogenase (short-subunit alcohol dehydrogenase family)
MVGRDGCRADGRQAGAGDWRGERLAATQHDARRLGRDVLAERVDVGDSAQMQAFADAVHERAGAVDLLVNNAGVGLGAGFLETPLEDWDWIVPINLMGVVHGCHMFVPTMVERGHGGHVVNLSSVAGYFANPSLAAYTATKFAVLGLSEALRIELRPLGIGVTAVCPGLINTPITRNSRLRGSAEAERERVVRLYERRNYGPDRVAQRIMYAVQCNRAVMPVTAEAWVMWWLARFAPSLARGVARAIDAGAR